LDHTESWKQYSKQHSRDGKGFWITQNHGSSTAILITITITIIIIITTTTSIIEKVIK